MKPRLGGWGVVVILFGLVGGLVGWASLRGSDPARASRVLRWGIVVSATSVVASIALYILLAVILVASVPSSSGSVVAPAASNAAPIVDTAQDAFVAPTITERVVAPEPSTEPVFEPDAELEEPAADTVDGAAAPESTAAPTSADEVPCDVRGDEAGVRMPFDAVIALEFRAGGFRIRVCRSGSRWYYYGLGSQGGLILRALETSGAPDNLVARNGSGSNAFFYTIAPGEPGEHCIEVSHADAIDLSGCGRDRSGA